MILLEYSLRAFVAGMLGYGAAFFCSNGYPNEALFTLAAYIAYLYETWILEHKRRK